MRWANTRPTGRMSRRRGRREAVEISGAAAQLAPKPEPYSVNAQDRGSVGIVSTAHPGEVELDFAREWVEFYDPTTPNI